LFRKHCKKEDFVNRAKLNYWVDVSIGIAFVLGAVSGLVFLLPANPDSGLNSGVLGVSYQVWDQVHTWSSLVMIAGVAMHLVLHWKWIIAMTKRMLPKMKQREVPESTPRPVGGKTASRGMNRRDFLRLGGMAAASVGLAVVGYKALLATEPAEISQGDNDTSHRPLLIVTQQSLQPEVEVGRGQPLPMATATPTVVPTESPPEGGVACPRGRGHCPYPGQCRRYVDSNNDGFCDYT
jgi:hypothetical protein